MTDPRNDPHGPTQLPDEQPILNATDWGNQTALRTGATSRWIVPAGELAIVGIALFCFAFQIQLILPILGIVFAATMWIVMFAVARRGGQNPRTNRTLAWLMGAMAAGLLLIAISLYIVESTRLPWS